MIEPMTLARPYARAAFDYALDKGLVADWGDTLTELSAATLDSRVVAVLSDPAKTGDVRASALLGLVDSAPAGLGNFLSVLADNGRLALLPEIGQLFADLRSQHEAVVDVEVTSAMDVSDADADKLAAAMSAKLSRSVNISTKTDPDLIGGAVIRAGDLVIDGSVRGRLNKLSGALTP